MRALTAATFAIWSFALGLAGCSDPCLDLAIAVCSCEQSTARRQQCERRVQQAADVRTPSAEQLELCDARLSTCTCEALAAGDLAACGLAP